MRALVVLLALVATPFVAGVSQGKLKTNNGVGHDAAHCAMRATLHPDQEINKCPAPAPQDPPPTPGDPPPPPVLPPPPATGCVNSGPAGGTASIDGQVFVDASPWPGLAGWCVELHGPVSATAVSDASGNYLFSGLPAGTYTVCEVLQSGWHETFPTFGPSCAGGFGYTITVGDAASASFIWFGNLTP
jgi:hypothetical protein